VLAAGPGLHFADPYALGLLFAGIAVFAAIGALSHQEDRAFSASIIYLGLGALAALAIDVLDIGWVDPLKDAELYQRAGELAVIVALFGTGLKLDKELTWDAWGRVSKLLLIAMPLTIAAIALFGTQVMGLSLGAAIVLGAILAPTDPVLAGDIGVGPPGDEEEHEPNFSITGEAGLNDGLAFPFVLLGVIVAGDEGKGWLGDWALTDVLYPIAVGLGIGAALGYRMEALAVWLRDRHLLSKELDGWLAIAAVLAIYGVTEAASAYGFLAAFAGGIAFRRYEHDHEYNETVHAGAETVEKFGELALSVLLALAGSRMDASERSFVAWFGVRGIGSLYYLGLVVGLGVLSDTEARTLFWTTAACVVVSILVHGATASPLSRRWLSQANGTAVTNMKAE
jgi:NhaP-type Na+/H+ or K+/H+ antiporter